MKYYVRFTKYQAYVYRTAGNTQYAISILSLEARSWEVSWSYDLRSKSTAVTLEELIENPQWFSPEYYMLMLEKLI